MGETFIPTWAFNSDVHKSHVRWDGGYVSSANWDAMYGFARLIHNQSSISPIIARSSNESGLTIDSPPSANEGKFSFGSSHPGIVNFLIGDGSVRPFPVTVDYRVLYRLGNVQDGEPVSLP